MSTRITSPRNPRLKFALSLHKASVRKKEGMFLIEGLREIKLAMQAGYDFHTFFICPEISDLGDIGTLSGSAGQYEVIETSKDNFKKLVYRENSDGLLAIARQRRLSLDDISFAGIPLVLVVESVEKPGNLGAILRTADAAGVDAVLICDGNTDIYNPNVVRSSLGSLFTNQLVSCSSEEAVEWLKNKEIRIFTTALSASKPYHDIDFTVPSAIVSGAEAAGVTGIWEENADARIIIPMFGKVDSMNVSVATSIILYEALRQRRFQG
jgi:RNA methyltransferase, TrmH family